MYRLYGSIALTSLVYVTCLQGCKTKEDGSGVKGDEIVADDFIITSRADSSLDLGYGIDAASMETRRRCIEDASLKPVDPNAPVVPNTDNNGTSGGGAGLSLAETGFSLDESDEDAVYANCAKRRTSDSCIIVKFCKDETALKATLSSSIKGAGTYASFKGTASSSSSANASSNSEKSYLVVKAMYIKDVKDIDVPLIRSDIMGGLKTNTVDSKSQFLTACGDKYVQFVARGGELIAVAELKKDSKEAKFAQENQLKIREMASGARAEASTSANFEASRSLMQTTVQVSEISGDDTVAMNLEQAIEKVQNFKKTVNANPNPSIMSFGLQPYSTASFKDDSGKIQLIDTALLPLRAKVTTALGKSELTNIFASLETAKKMQEHYTLLLEYFPDKVNAAFGGDISVKINELQEYIGLATTAINKCRTGETQDCDFPAFNRKIFEPKDTRKLVELMSTVALNRRPSGLYCTFDNDSTRYIYDLWVHSKQNIMKFQYEAGFWGLNSPIYDIPFSENPEFFTRYQANALSSKEVADFMNSALKKRSGMSGAATGGWGIKTCFVK